MNAEIFIPMYYMVLLTASVFLLSTIIRFKNVLIDKSHTGSELMKIPLPASAEQITKQADRAHQLARGQSLSPEVRGISGNLDVGTYT